MSGLVSFKVTKDMIAHPEQYPTVLKNGLPRCGISLSDFKAGKIALGGKNCHHYYKHKQLIDWLKPQEITYYGNAITIEPHCPECRDILNPKDITKLTEKEVLDMRKEPLEDEIAEEEDSQELEKEPLVQPSPNPNKNSKEKLCKAIKIAAIVTLTTAAIFISIRVMQ